MSKPRRNRREIAANAIGTDYDDLPHYQAGRHRPPVFDNGTGAVTVTFEGEKPPKGWEWVEIESFTPGARVWRMKS